MASLLIGSVFVFSSFMPDQGFLRGTWFVRCGNGHVDQVDGITRNHDCDHDGCGLKSVDGGTAWVVCPNGHATKVSGITESHLCDYRFPNGSMCGQQCRH